MKETIYSILLFSLLITSPLTSQSGEFTTHSNGLIYSTQTMEQLGSIVDSLNLQFKNCELDKTYTSMVQGQGIYFEIDSKLKRKGIIEDLENQIDFKTLIEKYDNFLVEKNEDLLLIANNIFNKKGQPVLQIATVPINFGYYGGHQFPDFSLNDIEEKKLKYVYAKTKEGVKGYYFPKGLKAAILPEKYARMVQYVDCMIDTSSQIYYPNAQSGYGFSDDESEINTFMALVNSYPNRPIFNYDSEWEDEDYNRYEKAYNKWNKARNNWVRNELSSTKKFQDLLDKGIEKAIKKGNTSIEFEDYVRQYRSNTEVLELKRSRRVVGYCSMDSSPRDHALNIAILSAETAKWDIFLRAHLDIMNDRFDRNSDGSYAWAQRQTYVKEIETLGLDIPTLLLGTCLKSGNTAKQHYWSSADRIGRAITESKEVEKIENTLQSMIADPTLDSYNRLLMLYVYRNHIGYLPEIAQADKLLQLAGLVETLPKYMAKQIDLN